VDKEQSVLEGVRSSFIVLKPLTLNQKCSSTTKPWTTFY